MQQNYQIGAVVLAAGKGTRLGGSIPKQHRLLHGEPMYMASLRAFASVAEISEIALVVDRAHLQEVEASLPGFLSEMEPAARPTIHVVEGGAERPDSVVAGLAAFSSAVRYVLVHDGARPYVTGSLIRRVADAVTTYGSAVPCIRPRDTIRTAEHTLDRSTLYLVQTPQGFRRDILEYAYEQAKQNGFAGTDDASYVEQLGVRPHLEEGDPANMKITIPGDLPEEEETPS